MVKIEEKKHVRAPIIKTAIEGIIPYSIDSMLSRIPIRVDPWDTITVYGAQLCRPPYDPYRETVDLSLNLKCPFQSLVLGSPIIIATDNKTTEVVHDALNTLGEQGIVYAAISPCVPERYKLKRNHKIILKDNGQDDGQNNADRELADGFLAECDERGIKRLKSYEKPVLAYARQPNQIAQILYAGADGVVADVSGHSMEQLRKIISAKKLFADYLRGADIDKSLIIADGPNDAGKVVKTIAMGAATALGVVYDTSMLFGEVIDLCGRIKEFSLRDISDIITNYLSATQVELTQLTAAPGYSKIHNVSHADLRTSSPDVSLATGILMEGLNESWLDFHKRKLAEEFRLRGKNPDGFDLGSLTSRLTEMSRRG